MSNVGMTYLISVCLCMMLVLYPFAHMKIHLKQPSAVESDVRSQTDTDTQKVVPLNVHITHFYFYKSICHLVQN